MILWEGVCKEEQEGVILINSKGMILFHSKEIPRTDIEGEILGMILMNIINNIAIIGKVNRLKLEEILIKVTIINSRNTTMKDNILIKIDSMKAVIWTMLSKIFLIRWIRWNLNMGEWISNKTTIEMHNNSLSSNITINNINSSSNTRLIMISISSIGSRLRRNIISGNSNRKLLNRKYRRNLEKSIRGKKRWENLMNIKDSNSMINGEEIKKNYLWKMCKRP